MPNMTVIESIKLCVALSEVYKILFLMKYWKYNGSVCRSCCWSLQLCSNFREYVVHPIPHNIMLCKMDKLAEKVRKWIANCVHRNHIVFYMRQSSELSKLLCKIGTQKLFPEFAHFAIDVKLNVYKLWVTDWLYHHCNVLLKSQNFLKEQY